MAARSCWRTTAADLLRRQRRHSGQQPAGQPHRALPLAGMLAAESKRPRPDGDRERLDGVGEDRALGRDARELSRIQRVGGSRRARAGSERARAARNQPRTVPGGRPRRRAITRCPARGRRGAALRRSPPIRRGDAARSTPAPVRASRRSPHNTPTAACRIALIRRLPPGLKRWRTGSPGPSAVEAGSGAEAVKRANPPSVNRRGSPTSTSSSATERVSRPQSSPSVEPLERTSACSCATTVFPRGQAPRSARCIGRAAAAAGGLAGHIAGGGCERRARPAWGGPPCCRAAARANPTTARTTGSRPRLPGAGGLSGSNGAGCATVRAAAGARRGRCPTRRA